MKQTKTKLLSLLLAIVMVAGMLPMSALATEPTEAMATIGDATYATLADAIAAAADGDTIELANGDHTMPNAIPESVTIQGAREAVIHISGAVTASGCELTFDGVTLEFPASTNYVGFHHSSKVVYKNCAINGMHFFYAPTVEVTKCVFTNYATYNLWTYGATNATFTDCSFYSGGRSVYVYNEVENSNFVANVAFTNCDFHDNDSQKEDNGVDDLMKGAVETGSVGRNNEGANKYYLTFTDCTTEGFHPNTTGNTLWGNKHNLDDNHLIVTVNTPAPSKVTTQEELNAAIIAAEGPTVIELEAGTYTLLVKDDKHPNMVGKNITFCGTKDVVFDLTGIVGQTWHTQDSGATIAFDGVTVKWNEDNEGYQGFINAAKVVYTDCTIYGTQFMGGDAEFTNCVFEAENTAEQGYAVYGRGNGTLTFTGCDFKTDGRAIMLFQDQTTEVNVVLKDCTFSDNGKYTSKPKAVVETGDGTLKTSKFVIDITNCVITQGFEANNSTSRLWGNKDSIPAERLSVTIDGESSCVHNFEEKVQAPTCTAKGYTARTCSVCGYSVKRDFVDATGHTYGDPKVTDATPDVNGKKVYTCSSCGAEKIEVIPALDHQFTSEITKEATCEEPGENTYTCTTCTDGSHTYTEEIPATGGHEWDEGTVTPPTCETSGYTTQTCAKCNAKQITNPTAMTAHTFGVDSVCTVCGTKNVATVAKVDLVDAVEEMTQEAVPETLEYTTVEELMEAMKDVAEVAETMTSQMYDISLMVDDKALGANNFPAEGHVFTIPVPETADTNGQIIVSHMITHTYGGNQAGTVEVLKHWIENGNICFRTYSTSPVMVSFVEVPVENKIFKSATVTLGGELGVNFKLSVPEEILADKDNASMVFTVNGETTDVPLSSASLEAKSTGAVYVFTYHVAAKQMTDTIKADFRYNGESVAVLEYSVQKYASYIINNDYTQDEKNLAMAMLNYGATAQQMFSYNLDALAVDPLYKNLTVGENFAGVTRDGEVAGITYATTSAIWESNMALRHYFTLEEGKTIDDYVFTASKLPTDAKVEVKMVGNRCCVEIADIVAKELGNDITVTVTPVNAESNEVFTITCSVYTYCKAVANSATTTDVQKAAANAVYVYGEMAKAYFAAKYN